MGIWTVIRVAMPDSAFTILAVDTGAVEYKRVTVYTFLDVGVNLNKTIGTNKKAQLDGVISLINGLDKLNKSPFGRRMANFPLKAVGGHELPSKSVNCRSVLRIPSTAKSQS